MTEEELAYIVDWYESGNESREDDYDMVASATSLAHGSDYLYQLNKAGITIAKLTLENRKLRQKSGAEVMRDIELGFRHGTGFPDRIEELEEEIRKLRAAFEQACETADIYASQAEADEDPQCEKIVTMRANRRSLGTR